MFSSKTVQIQNPTSGSAYLKHEPLAASLQQGLELRAVESRALISSIAHARRLINALVKSLITLNDLSFVFLLCNRRNHSRSRIAEEGNIFCRPFRTTISPESRPISRPESRLKAHIPASSSMGPTERLLKTSTSLKWSCLLGLGLG